MSKNKYREMVKDLSTDDRRKLIAEIQGLIDENEEIITSLQTGESHDITMVKQLVKVVQKDKEKISVLKEK